MQMIIDVLIRFKNKSNFYLICISRPLNFSYSSFFMRELDNI